ncbi:HAD-IC family P-type ATPase [Candidatus Parcubacteria bacterium]|nr:HAD-IC family P-type ATPase [Patescibacteria group bacterium]MCG2694273.1 HAD-IC family P-type ATPase [Candidatus Parcubacteria bacterium]
MSIAFHNLTVEGALEELGTSIDGLKEKEIKARLKQYGKNELPREKMLSRFSIFLSQFKSPLVYILLFAAIISGILMETIDMVIILAAIFINVIIGFAQEDKANRSLEQLKTLVERRSHVIRGGREIEIKAEDLVPGDIVVLEEGSRVPADGRIIKENDLEVNEASLTGESLPIKKTSKKIDKNIVLAERKNMVFMGTLVTGGRAYFVVTDIGIKSHFGEIASLVRETKEEKTPLQERIGNFSKILGAVIVFVTIILFLVGIALGRSPLEMFLTSIAVAVASIPEGLPISITVILAIGMQKMSRHKALTRKMIAAETLGSVSVICTDKTGTLTIGEMRAVHLMSYCGDLFIQKNKQHKAIHKELLDQAMKISLLCNNAVAENMKGELKSWKILGDSTEKPLLIKGYEIGYDKQTLEKKMPRLHELTFNSERKFMATLNKTSKIKAEIFIKGAPELLLEKSKYFFDGIKTLKLGSKEKAYFKKEIEKLTSNGLRVLGLAYKDAENGREKIEEKDIKDIVFVGIMGLKDPLRETAKSTIQLTRDAGIRPVIVTGDHILTAKAIGEEIGFRIGEENVLEGKDIDELSDAELKEKIKDIDIFARVLPKHKLRIIDAWQSRGEIVAMTGDGVNDAPAIKRADIGIALGSGSDVTKETSDMVLLDDNFSTIIKAIERGRILFDNIRKVIVYLLSDSFTEVILIAGALILGLPLPVTAAQILWVNIIDDGLPGLSLAFDKGEKDVMERKPRKRTTPILNNEMKAIIFIMGILTDLFLLGVFYFVWELTKDLNYSRTISFVGLGIDSLFIVYAARSLHHSIWHTKFWNNQFLNLSVLAGVLMLFLVVYLPVLQTAFKTIGLGWREWVFLLGIGMINLVLIEFIKWFFIHRHKVD